MIVSHLFQNSSPPAGVVIDSCGLIDGRIIELLRTGFMRDPIIIPQFIIDELRTLAAGDDVYKCQRALQALDIVSRLQELSHPEVRIDARVYDAIRLVDQKLLQFAEDTAATLYTLDNELIVQARERQIAVLNINELALALRPPVLPGDRLETLLVRKGSGHNQAVGYTADGTMIVVDHATKLIGRTVSVVCTKMYQTAAGKMLFGRLD